MQNPITTIYELGKSQHQEYQAQISPLRSQHSGDDDKSAYLKYSTTLAGIVLAIIVIALML